MSNNDKAILSDGLVLKNFAQDPEVLWCGRVIHPMIYDWGSEDELAEQSLTSCVDLEEELCDEKSVIGQLGLSASTTPVPMASESVKVDDSEEDAVTGQELPAGTEPEEWPTGEGESPVPLEMALESSIEYPFSPTCMASGPTALRIPSASTTEGHENLSTERNANTRTARLMNMTPEMANDFFDPNEALVFYTRFLTSSTTPAEFLLGLASQAISLYEDSAGPHYIDKAINLIAAAQDTANRSNEAISEATLCNINIAEGETFLSRYQLTMNTEDIERAVNAWKLALDRVEGDRRVAVLMKFGISLTSRFKRLGDVADINKAIMLLEEAIGQISDRDPDRPSLLSSLGTALMERFKRLGAVNDLNKAASLLQQAVDLTPHKHPFESHRLSTLGALLEKRFELLGSLVDIDRAIHLQKQALNLLPEGDPHRPGRLSYLGTSLVRRFERLGEITDINSALLAQGQAVKDTPDGHIDKPAWLSNLGMALQARFKRLGDLADINQAILRKQQAVDLTPNGHLSKPSRLNNLANAFTARFDRLGNIPDIDNAIAKQQQAVNLTPDSHAEKPWLLNCLGISLCRRFERLGDIADLNNGISLQQQSVTMTADGHAAKPVYLSNLGNSLRTRFERFGDIADINNAILSQQAAVDLTPDEHVERPTRLNGLGTSLAARFGIGRDINDIHNAILNQQQAVKLTPDGHTKKPSRLTNLATSLEERFKRSKSEADIDCAIVTRQMAVDLTPDGHIDKPSWLNNLAESLLERFLHLRNPADLDRINLSLREAALSPSGRPSVQFTAAFRWAGLFYPQLEACRTLFSLIPRVVWLGKTIQQRYEDLKTLGEAAMWAVSAACQMEEYDLALEWGEQGRAIIWGQILLLRSPLDGLHAAHPKIAEELKKTSRALEVAGTGNTEDSLSQEDAAQEHRRLAEQWGSLLAEIRALPDFGNFLRPKLASELKKASTNGTIVIVNVSDFRSDALVLREGSSSICHVHLSTLSAKNVNSARDRFHQSLRTSKVRYRDTERGSVQAGMQGAIPNVLRMLWLDIAKPIVDYLGYNTPQPTRNLPRITWCLTGALAALPLHAAGIYGTPNKQDKLFNYVVSSYTPSLSSLIEGLIPRPANPSTRSLLAITQHHTPNLPSLPGTMREIDQVKDHMDKCNIPLTRMDGHQATVKAVYEAMSTHSWIHLSCHGKQDALEPTKSAFFLHDGTLELGEIMKKPLKHAELAYLSACQTALGDTNLPDEAMHLAAGMFTAGYRSVIATLWAIRDYDAPIVAGEFYNCLLDNPSGGAAHALHEAVRELRQRVGENDFLSWVPYIHIGH